MQPLPSGGPATGAPIIVGNIPIAEARIAAALRPAVPCAANDNQADLFGRAA